MTSRDITIQLTAEQAAFVLMAADERNTNERSHFDTAVRLGGGDLNGDLRRWRTTIDKQRRAVGRLRDQLAEHDALLAPTSAPLPEKGPHHAP